MKVAFFFNSAMNIYNSHLFGSLYYFIVAFLIYEGIPQKI